MMENVKIVKSKMLLLLVLTTYMLLSIKIESFLPLPSKTISDQLEGYAQKPDIVDLVGYGKTNALRLGRTQDERFTMVVSDASTNKPSDGILTRAFNWLLGKPPQDRSISLQAPQVNSNSLQTSFDGQESGYGIMFEVETTSISGVILKSLGLNVDTTTSNMISVYSLEGSFQGNEQDRGAWKRVFSSSVTCSGDGNPTMLDPSEFAAVKIYPGKIRSFYVVCQTPDLRYTTEKESNTVVAKNSNMLLRVGKGIDLIFGDVIGNRAFNGVLQYEALSTDDNAVFDDGLASPIGQPVQLSTTLNGGNYAFGIMFDVLVRKDMEVVSLDLHLTAKNIVTANVYTRTGTHLQNEINPDSWFLVCSVTLVGAGFGVPTPIPVEMFNKLALKAGSRQAFYVTLSAAVLQYSNGSEVNRVFVENDDLKILEGTAVARPFFGGTFVPRVFNGAVHYQLLGNPTLADGREFGENDAAVTSYAMGQLSVLQVGLSGSSGSYGFMFDVVADKQLYIAGIDILTTVVNAAVTAKVFTKEGSHVGFELDRGNAVGTAWEIMQDIAVAGFGQGRLTPLPDFAQPIPMGSGKTQAFYLLLNTAELRYDTSSDSDQAGQVVDANDQNIKVIRGTGIGEGTHFYPSRIFDGAIRYYPMIGLLS